MALKRRAYSFLPFFGISTILLTLHASISQSIYHILLSVVYILLLLTKVEEGDVNSIVLFLH